MGCEGPGRGFLHNIPRSRSLGGGVLSGPSAGPAAPWSAHHWPWRDIATGRSPLPPASLRRPLAHGEAQPRRVPLTSWWWGGGNRQPIPRGLSRAVAANPDTQERATRLRPTRWCAAGEDPPVFCPAAPPRSSLLVPRISKKRMKWVCQGGGWPPQRRWEGAVTPRRPARRASRCRDWGGAWRNTPRHWSPRGRAPASVRATMPDMWRGRRGGATRSSYLKYRTIKNPAPSEEARQTLRSKEVSSRPQPSRILVKLDGRHEHEW